MPPPVPRERDKSIDMLPPEGSIEQAFQKFSLLKRFPSTQQQKNLRHGKKFFAVIKITSKEKRRHRRISYIDIKYKKINLKGDVSVILSIQYHNVVTGK